MRAFHSALTCLLCLLLSGCSLHHWGFDTGAASPSNDNPERQLEELRALNPDPKDQPLHLLHLALFEHLNGQFARSNESLGQVKPLLDFLEVMSVVENLGASTLNETLRSYQASPSERALLQQLAMTNFLFQSQLGPARVEALQTDILLQRLAIKNPLQGQLASTRFVTGLVYEFNMEWDNALIAYGEAQRILQARSQPVPSAVAISMARMRQRLGLPPDDSVTNIPLQEGGDLIILFWQGQVSKKEQIQFRIYNHELRQHIALALPAYPDSYPPPRSFTVQVDEEKWHGEPLENLEERMREDLARQRPAIIAAASARLLAKNRLASKAEQVDSVLGVLVDFALTLGEIADRRSWNSLPAHIQVARIPIKPGVSERIKVAGQQLSLPSGGTSLVLVHDASHRIFTYPSPAAPLEETSHDY